MAVANYHDGAWGEASLSPYQGIVFDPAAKSLHYGQQVFEGMKAFALEGGGCALFRPELNWARFNASATRMAMPSIPRDLFMQAVESLVHHLGPIVPRGRGESLYLRPIMLATEAGLSLKPSNTYLFMVIASPSGGYFSAAKVTALVERCDARAAPGGTGAYKVAGNYGASIRGDMKAAQFNCQQTLWLDALQKSHIEEFSGMNFFAVVDSQLVTPPVSETILRGVTRDSIVALARHLGLAVDERPILVNELLEQIEGGRCTEIFACGTAAVITPVHALREENGKTFELPPVEASMSLRLREMLLDIQTGRRPGPEGWVRRVNAGSYLN